jgi:hypothetical protein
MLDWIGGEFDPEAFDIDTVNGLLYSTPQTEFFPDRRAHNPEASTTGWFNVRCPGSISFAASEYGTSAVRTSTKRS